MQFVPVLFFFPQVIVFCVHLSGSAGEAKLLRRDLKLKKGFTTLRTQEQHVPGGMFLCVLTCFKACVSMPRVKEYGEKY